MRKERKKASASARLVLMITLYCIKFNFFIFFEVRNIHRSNRVRAFVNLSTFSFQHLILCPQWLHLSASVFDMTTTITRTIRVNITNFLTINTTTIN